MSPGLLAGISRVRRHTRGVRDVLTRMLGVPDYDAYLAHHAATHPHCAPVSRERFISEQLTERYSRPGARCC